MNNMKEGETFMAKKAKDISYLDDIRTHLREAETIAEEEGIPFVAAIEKDSGALFKYSANQDKSGERLVNAFQILEKKPESKKDLKDGDKMASVVKDGTKIQRALSTVKTEGTEALWRTAASQTVLAVYDPLLAALKRQHLSQGVIDGVKTFLETEIGRATVAMLLGIALQNIPNFGSNPKVQRLASEMRIYGMTIGGNMIAGIVMDPLRGFMSDLIAGLPEAVVTETVEEESVEELAANKHSSVRIA